MVPCYSDAAPGTVAALINSDGLIEVFVNRGDASNQLHAATGEPVLASVVAKPGQT
jgi:S-adenosylmethionine hydrolase